MSEQRMNNQEHKQSITISEYMIQKEFEALMCEYLNSNHRRKVEHITKAFNFANQAHAGMRRRDGDPYIMHPLAVARIVCGEMGLGSTSIRAALLHDVVEDTEYVVEDISNMFGEKTAELVYGLTKISGGVFANKDAKQIENLRRLLITMNKDIRVVLIKIADRLHNMRTLGAMRADKQYKIASETMFIYAPLAHRLGLFAIKTELEDLSFKHEHPDDYKRISEKLKNTEDSRQRLFDNFAKPVRQQLQGLSLTYEMKTRVKSAYSIWNKMKSKNVPFEDIYDIFAIRIIFEPTGDINEKNLCWDIYSAITDIYQSRQDRLRDWVSHAKANGYRALHFTVMGPDGQWIEIQIRSKRMDEIAEKGFAAHWKYKNNNTDNTEESTEKDVEFDKWIQTIIEVLENPGPNTLDYLGMINLSLLAAEIFIFTPKGDLKTLPKDATALDFAYSLHTDIGNSCIGAKVNHRLMPLSHKLASGDQVEILTSKSQHPKPEWLNIATTAKARTKIESVLRRERKELANAGKKKVEESFKKESIKPTKSDLEKLSMYFGFSNLEDFYYAIEKGDISIPDNLNKLIKEKNNNSITGGIKKILRIGTKKTSIKDSTVNSDKKIFDKTQPYELCEDVLGQHNYIVANCCKPIPGDEVFGFINEDNKVVVHKRLCNMGIKIKNNFGDRILSTVWSNHINSSFEATIHIVGIDAVGVLKDISQTISEFHVNIIRLLIETKDGVFDGKINLLVHDVRDIQKMCTALSEIKSVRSVSRVAE